MTGLRSTSGRAPALPAVDAGGFDLGPRLGDFPVGTPVVAQSVSLRHRKKLLRDRLHRLLLQARHRPADAVQARQVAGQRLFHAEIGIQQHRVGAVLGQRKMGGIPLVVAAVSFVIVHAIPLPVCPCLQTAHHTTHHITFRPFQRTPSARNAWKPVTLWSGPCPAIMIVRRAKPDLGSNRFPVPSS